jgi:hypothetical protein
MGIHCAEHTSSIYKKLSLASPTSEGRSVGTVRSWTEATEYVVFFVLYDHWLEWETAVSTVSNKIAYRPFAKAHKETK